MNIKNFTDYVMNVCPDNEFEEKFKSLYYGQQFEFVLYMIDIFRTWTKEDFQKFKERNIADIIFGNLTMDSLDLFIRIISMDYKRSNQEQGWYTWFVSVCKNVKGIDKELALYRMEKDEFNDHQIKNRK